MRRTRTAGYLNTGVILLVHITSNQAAPAAGSHEDGATMDLTTCPECGNAAEIQWRDVLESTDGPVEHAKVLCVERHTFLLPVASLASPRLPARGGHHVSADVPRGDGSR